MSLNEWRVVIYEIVRQSFFLERNKIMADLIDLCWDHAQSRPLTKLQEDWIGISILIICSTIHFTKCLLFNDIAYSIDIVWMTIKGEVRCNFVFVLIQVIPDIPNKKWSFHNTIAGFPKNNMVTSSIRSYGAYDFQWIIGWIQDHSIRHIVWCSPDVQD